MLPQNNRANNAPMSEADEQKLADSALDTVIKDLAAFKKEVGDELNKQLLKEAKGGSDQEMLKLVALGELNARILGLDKLFNLVKNLMDASPWPFVKNNKFDKIDLIKAFLKESSPQKTDASGTAYLGSLFEFKVEDGRTNSLAKSLVAILQQLKEHNSGFLIGVIKKISDTAGPRIKILLERLPTLEAGIKAYEKQFEVTAKGVSSSSNSPSVSSSSTSNYQYGPMYSQTQATVQGRVIQQAAIQNNNNATVKGGVVPRKQ